jgi:deazaflavin-dependent oxidoreductase (nitroreductase family)
MDMKETNRRVIEQFRAGGEVEGMHRDRLVLLTTTGRKSGEPRTTPMMFVAEGDHILVIASNMGAKRHPAWYRNVRDDPRVHVELDGDEYDAIATVLDDSERDAAWQRITASHPFFLDHEQSAERVIPVVRLERE